MLLHLTVQVGVVCSSEWAGPMCLVAAVRAAPLCGTRELMAAPRGAGTPT